MMNMEDRNESVNTQSSSPTVTVLMPVYNGERYVRQAIDSILAQSFMDLEFVIVDDGSTDGTHEILSSYEDRRIKLLKHARNMGVVASLNDGLRLAHGELIARQDADDISSPERLARQVRFLRERPEVGLVGSSYIAINEEGANIRKIEYETEDLKLRWILLFRCPFRHTSVMFRRALVTSVGGYAPDDRHCEDYGLWSRIAAESRIANIADVLAKSRWHSESVSHLWGTTMQETSLEISRRNLQALTGSDVSGRLLRCMQVLRKGTAKQFSIDQLDNEVTPFVQDLRTRVLPLVLTRFCVANDIHGASKRAFEMWAKRDLGDAILRTVNALMEKPEHIRKRFVLSDLWFQAAMMEDADIFKPSSLKIIAKVLIGSQCLRAIRQVQNNLVLQGLPTNGTRP